MRAMTRIATHKRAARRGTSAGRRNPQGYLLVRVRWLGQEGAAVVDRQPRDSPKKPSKKTAPIRKTERP